MNAYVLFKNGNIEYCNRYKNSKYKQSKIKAYLIHCNHPTFGDFYVSVKPKHMRWLDKIKRSIVSYRFLDGVLIDPEEDGYLFQKNKYWYNNQTDLISKIIEIMICENIFNDCFWVYDSYFQYIYDNLKIKLKINKRTKILTKSIYDKIIGEKLVIKDFIINIKKDEKYKITKVNKAKNIPFVQLYPNIFFRLDSDIFKYGKYKINTSIILKFENYLLNERYEKGDTKDITCLAKLLEAYVSKQVIRKIECTQFDEPIYSVKTHVKFKYKDKEIKFNKFMKKYFIDIDL